MPTPRASHGAPGQRTIEDVWARFVASVSRETPAMASFIRAPASQGALAEAERRLGCALPDELRHLYVCADGFALGAFLLRDDYRILPVDEMVEASLGLVGASITLDFESGEVSRAKKVIRLVLARARPDDEDVEQISLRLRARKPTIEMWYREGGIHTYAEVVDWQESLTDWLALVVDEYYG